MKITLLALLAALIGLAFAAGAGSAAPTRSAHCFAKQEKLKGKQVIVNCGPATAKLTSGGKTYKFKQGTCLRSGTSVTLALGTSLAFPTGNGNGGFVDLSLMMLTNKLAQLTVDDGKLSGSSALTKFSGIATKGTFAGTLSGSSSEHFTGSWNCGGPIQKF